MLANILPLVGKHDYFHLNIPVFPEVPVVSLISPLLHMLAQPSSMSPGVPVFGSKTLLKNKQNIDMISL